MSFIFDAINWKLKIMKKWLCKICFLWENKNRTVVIFLLVGLFVSLGFVYVLLVRNKRLNKENRLLQRQYEAVDNALFRMEEMQKTYLQYENMKKIDDIDLKTAMLIGCFQCLALFPGFSRSAATIMGGMILGARRPLAAEYSFIAAVPIMVAATGFDLLKSLHLFTAADIPFFAVGMIGSFISALIAVKAFVRLVGHMTLVPFAVYRLLLAPFIWYFMVH